jgi:hypothetical protein
MVKRIIAIGGEPGTGKTKLMKDVMKDYTLTPFNYGLIKGEYDDYKKVYFIGVFDGSKFEGSDKISIKFYNDFIEFLNQVEGVVVFEGDRLFSKRVLATQYPFIKLVLTASKETMDTRYKLRGVFQAERFNHLKTKSLHNIIKTYDDIVFLNNEGDNTENINIIKDYITK